MFVYRGTTSSTVPVQAFSLWRVPCEDRRDERKGPGQTKLPKTPRAVDEEIGRRETGCDELDARNLEAPIRSGGVPAAGLLLLCEDADADFAYLARAASR
jgi:hypothetical protein